jgi:hypothetical protein
MTEAERGIVPCRTCGKPHEYRPVEPHEYARLKVMAGMKTWADPADGHSYAKMDAAEAIASERARILRSAPPERLPSGSPVLDRERAAFNEGRAAVLRIVDGAE